MRITIATGPCFPCPPTKGGGAVRAWLGLGQAFQKSGHEVTFFSRQYSHQVTNEILNGCRILRWGGYEQPSNVWSSLLKDFQYASGALSHLPSADILVTHDFWMPLLCPLFHPAAGRVAVACGRYPKNQFVLYQQAALIMAPSSAILYAMQEQQKHSRVRRVHIPNPYDGSEFYAATSVTAAPQSILFAGRIHPEKGLETLIQAFKTIHQSVPAARLTLMGPQHVEEGGGGVTYVSSLQTLCANLPIQILPPVYDTESLRKAYQSHSIFCYPTVADRGEAMPVAPLEAMACGCIPIVSANPVFHDWLEEGINARSYDHHQPDAATTLATHITGILSQPELAQSMRAAALLKVKQFELKQVAKLYLEAFETVLSEKH